MYIMLCEVSLRDETVGFVYIANLYGYKWQTRSMLLSFNNSRNCTITLQFNCSSVVKITTQPIMKIPDNMAVSVFNFALDGKQKIILQLEL